MTDELTAKYKLTNDFIEFKGATLYRIEALKDFADVKKGDLGGYIQKEDNLEHKGNCWVYDKAKVHGDASVASNVQVRDNAEVCQWAFVHGNVKLRNNCKVCGDVEVAEEVEIYENATVEGKGYFAGHSKLCGNTQIR